MQRAGGLVRWTRTETIGPPFSTLGQPNDFVAEGEYVYFVASAAHWPPYARYFGQPSPLSGGASPDFMKVYGPRPIDDLSLETTWLQQLSLWAGLGLPDGVTAQQAALVDTIFVEYGMGAPVAFKLTNGARLLHFPDADKRTALQSEYPRVIHDARVAYGGGAEYIVIAYQAVLRDLGVPVANLVPFLSGPRIGHSG